MKVIKIILRVLVMCILLCIIWYSINFTFICFRQTAEFDFMKVASEAFEDSYTFALFTGDGESEESILQKEIPDEGLLISSETVFTEEQMDFVRRLSSIEGNPLDSSVTVRLRQGHTEYSIAIPYKAMIYVSDNRSYAIGDNAFTVNLFTLEEYIDFSAKNSFGQLLNVNEARVTSRNEKGERYYIKKLSTDCVIVLCMRLDDLYERWSEGNIEESIKSDRVRRVSVEPACEGELDKALYIYEDYTDLVKQEQTVSNISRSGVRAFTGGYSSTEITYGLYDEVVEDAAIQMFGKIDAFTTIKREQCVFGNDYTLILDTDASKAVVVSSLNMNTQRIIYLHSNKLVEEYLNRLTASSDKEQFNLVTHEYTIDESVPAIASTVVYLPEEESTGGFTE